MIPFDEFASLRSPLFERALEVVMHGMLTPRCAGTTQVFQRHIGVFCTGFNGYVHAVPSEDTLNVQRESTTSNARLEDGIVGAKAKFGEEKACIFATDGLGPPHHASTQFGETGWDSLEFLLSDFHAFADGDIGQCLMRIEDAQSLDFDLPINQFNDVSFAVLFSQYGPITGSHIDAHRVVDVKVRMEGY